MEEREWRLTLAESRNLSDFRASLPEAIFDAIEDRLTAQSPSVGTVSGSSEIRLLWSPGAMDWKRILGGLRGDELESDFRLSRPSRRLQDEKYILPVRSRGANKPRVMVVIDTSGSISASDLAEIAGELERMARSFALSIVECDYAIKRVYPFSREELGHFVGRGGTSFLPPFESHFLRRFRPGVVVYFTDGMGKAPTNAPSMPVFWVLTKGGSRPASLGREIRMGSSPQ